MLPSVRELDRFAALLPAMATSSMQGRYCARAGAGLADVAARCGFFFDLSAVASPVALVATDLPPFFLW